jgi:hypothetical protein
MWAMQTLILTFVLFVAAVLLMTAVVLMSGRNLKGSCGGPSCKCATDGKAIGSCEFKESTLPTHPSK